MTTVPLQYAWRGLAAVAGLSIIQLFAVPPAAADYDVGAIHIACNSLRRDGRVVSCHPPAISNSSARANAMAKSRLSKYSQKNAQEDGVHPNPNNASAMRAGRDRLSGDMMLSYTTDSMKPHNSSLTSIQRMRPFR
jgi:hypothetical protein